LTNRAGHALFPPIFLKAGWPCFARRLPQNAPVQDI
jgi:hypothetical protein